MKGAGFERAQDSEHGFAVESGVNGDGNPYARVYFGGVKQSMGVEDGWTIIRLFAEALAAAEADAMVYRFFERQGGQEIAAKTLLMMRQERERADVSMERTHFYRRVTGKEKEGNVG